MKYASTRGEAPVLGFSDALLAGLARDGGLYLPQDYPHFSPEKIRALRGKSYAEVALDVLTPFVGGEIAQSTVRLPQAATGLFQAMLLFILLATDVLVKWRLVRKRRAA